MEALVEQPAELGAKKTTPGRRLGEGGVGVRLRIGVAVMLPEDVLVEEAVTEAVEEDEGVLEPVAELEGVGRTEPTSVTVSQRIVPVVAYADEATRAAT